MAKRFKVGLGVGGGGQGGGLVKEGRSDYSKHSFFLPLVFLNDPEHDKTNKITCAHREDPDQPNHLTSLIGVIVVHMKTLGH